MVTLTSSSIMDFMTCPRMYLVKHILGFHPKEESWKLRVGSVYHEGCRVRWEKGLDEALIWVQKFFSDHFHAHCQEEDFSAEHLEFQEAMVLGMVENTPWDVRDLDEAEKEFWVSLDALELIPDGLSQEYGIAGKVDGVGKRDGRPVIREYKTKGDISKAAKSHAMDRNLQASLYYYAFQRALGYEQLEGVQFCLVRRPSIARRQKEKQETFCKRVRQDYKDRPDFYFSDNVTYRDPRDNGFLTNLNTLVHLIDENTQKNRWYENLTQCKGFGKGCAYLPYCTKAPGWMDHFQNLGPDAHPELVDMED